MLEEISRKETESNQAQIEERLRAVDAEVPSSDVE